MTRHPMRFAVAATALAAWAMLAGGAAAAGQDVTIANFAFAPQTVTVAVGDTVTWTNNDTTTHQIVSKGDPFPGDGTYAVSVHRSR